MKLLRYLAALAALGLLWQAGVWLLGERVLPSPLAVGRHLAYAAGTADFWRHVRASGVRALAGVFSGFAVAFPLGLLLGHMKRLDAWASPFIFLTYPAPKILALPALLVLLGLGEAPKIILIALTVGYQVLAVTRDSVRGLDPRYLDSFAAMHSGGRNGRFKVRRALQLARHVLVPAALPSAVTSLRLAAGTAVAVLFMAESFVTDQGLGFLIMDAWGGLDLPRMFSGIIAMSLLGALLYEACNLIERLFCRWAYL
ncbi:MAG: ABC transporter permease subunit [Candidatus Adiutrix sp.]|jgi:NitT/TauT family transport system permease protein|nr:ABC transporter permease subunit [Candidatus Adiutrix sp.]